MRQEGRTEGELGSGMDGKRRGRESRRALKVAWELTQGAAVLKESTTWVCVCACVCVYVCVCETQRECVCSCLYVRE